MIGFSLIAPGMDAFAKLAGAAIPVGETLAFRFGIQALLLLPLALALGLITRQSPNAVLWHFIRAALILLATGFFFTALKVMPIADAIAIFFVEPFILTLFGAVFLGETIGWRRVLACAIGFAGAMLVIRPSFAAFGPVALFPLGTAVTFALYMIVNRRTARDQHPVEIQAWTALAACALILPLLIAFQGSGFQPLDPVMPEGRYWFYLAGVGVIASISHLCVSGALRFAPASTVAPLQYLEIIAATGLGYMIFADLPDTQTFVGIAIIISSGLFVIWRENKAPDMDPTPATRAAPTSPRPGKI
ncbi:putative membrane protein [Candidatus Rhodobacter oscarellae]|uniref:Putative membrane protein n=2 Tax=Candidatus Rhodobacter oscarellae TaxID=1675527 RepID=A0A0J9H576_9RHOB|nr:putative membrane protein [Candidatus Rhodobacter lobularis]